MFNFDIYNPKELLGYTDYYTGPYNSFYIGNPTPYIWPDYNFLNVWIDTIPIWPDPLFNYSLLNVDPTATYKTASGQPLVPTEPPEKSKLSLTYYFAEGYTGAGFQEYLTLRNPNSSSANLSVEYQYRGGGGTTKHITIGANSRETIDVNAAVGPDKEVSAKVTSDILIVAERPMYFNSNSIDGGHDVNGVTTPRPTWYFAEGYTGNGFQEWLCLQNPNSTPATITYMFRGRGAKVQTVYVGANTRETIDVNSAVGENKEVSVKVESTQPIVAERPMYFNFNGINGGHDIVGY